MGPREGWAFARVHQDSQALRAGGGRVAQTLRGAGPAGPPAVWALAGCPSCLSSARPWLLGGGPRSEWGRRWPQRSAPWGLFPHIFRSLRRPLQPPLQGLHFGTRLARSWLLSLCPQPEPERPNQPWGQGQGQGGGHSSPPGRRYWLDRPGRGILAQGARECSRLRRWALPPARLLSSRLTMDATSSASPSERGCPWE